MTTIECIAFGMTTMEWLTFGMLVVAIVSLLYSNSSTKKILAHSSEMNLQQNRSLLFAEDTRRYQEIIINMPDIVMSGEAKLQDKNVYKHMILYFDLCSEEYHLFKQGLIPEDIWSNWKEGMTTTMNHKNYLVFWREYAQLYNEEFYRFFNHEIINHKEQEK